MNEARPIPTGNAVLDTLIEGGLPRGCLILVRGEEGAGATEFALSVLRGAVQANTGVQARFATAIRAPARAEQDAAAFFAREKDAALIEFVPTAIGGDQVDLLALLDRLRPGALLAIETAAALEPLLPGPLVPALQALADRASEAGVTILLLHHRGTLTGTDEARVAEASDGLLTFSWREASTSRRRILRIEKLRGAPGVLDGDHTPILEVALRRGTGFTLSIVKSVM